MDLYVAFHLQGGTLQRLDITEDAAEAVRLKFNPSALETVSRLKMLAAAFIAECDRQAGKKDEAASEFAQAKTHMQSASMWAVLGATKGL